MSFIVSVSENAQRDVDRLEAWLCAHDLNAAVRVGPAAVSVQTYREGTSIPCGGETQVLAFPEQLAAGATAVQWAKVSCAPSQEGRYELVGRFRLADLPGIEAGRVRLTVSKDSMLFAPLPIPPWDEQPFQRRPE